MLDVIIDNRLRLNHKELPKEAYKELKESLTYKNPDYAKSKMMGFQTKGIEQFITSYTIDSHNSMSLARGAGYKLKEVCRNHGIKINFIDKRLNVPYDGFNTTIKLRDYQLTPCNQLVKLENSLIQGVCGSGKTVILLRAIEEIAQKTLIIVHERKLQQQWVDNIKEFFGLEDDEVGIIGGIAKKPRVRPITVAMQQSLLKTADKYKDEFGCIVGDEVHRFAASTFQKTVNAFPAKYRIGATATPKRKDGKHYLVFDQFGKISSRITDDDLLALDMTHDVKMVVVKTDFEYTGKMDSKPHYVLKGLNDEGQPIYENEPVEYVNNNELLEQLILDKNRNNLIYRFLSAEVEKKNYCILLSDRRRFCHNWQRWLGYENIEAKLLVGGAEYKEEGDLAIKRIMGPGDLHVVIGTTVADEGLDIKRLNRGFSATPTATNERRIVQQAGRIKRKCEGKDDAIWYYFLDHKVKGYDKHLKLLKKYFRTVEVLENAAEVDEYLYHTSGK